MFQFAVFVIAFVCGGSYNRNVADCTNCNRTEKVEAAWPHLDGEYQNEQEVHKMYAIIETGGKQIRVEEGATIFVEKLNAQEGEEVVFDKVVVYANRTTRVGTPYVKGVKVNAKVEKQGKGKKITIFKYKAKKGSSRRKQGHRQPYTKLTVTSIEA